MSESDRETETVFVTDSVARSRTLCAGLLLLTVATGLASRRFPAWQPELVSRYAGDTLWAAMVFWGLALLGPRAKTLALSGGAIAIAWVVELSQLYRAPWLDAVRATRMGALALGQGFLWSDLACYVLGVCMAAIADHALRREIIES